MSVVFGYLKNLGCQIAKAVWFSNKIEIIKIFKLMAYDFFGIDLGKDDFDVFETLFDNFGQLGAADTRHDHIGDQ